MKPNAEILSEAEQQAVSQFVNNPVAFEAVRKVILAGITQGVIAPGVPFNPAENFALQFPFAVDMQDADVDDRILGQKLRATVRGIRMVEQGMKQLETYKKEPKPTGKKGEANKAL